ncbi:MAG TPA: L-lactate permease [Hyphomonadaceae bacterium]|jgi:lactate permease|nr:L-lactate permease [Hyphomonadaceae bacterium]
MGPAEPWVQVYDPLGNPVLSTLAAAVPIVLLLALIASGKMKAHWAALIALVVAMLVASFVFTMPIGMTVRATALGALTGFFPIGWIILNVIFLYRLTVEKGWFAIIQSSIAGVTPDRRLQLLLIAFCFGAFFEGAAGFGTPVAVTAAVLIGLGFSPLAAAGLSLIANTAPVAFGALGAPIAGLATATGIDANVLGQMIGRQLPFFSVLVPFWLVAAFAGWRGMLQVWPAVLVAGVSFAIPQFLISNFVGPGLVDIGASVASMAVLILFLRLWKPKEVWTSPKLRQHDDSVSSAPVPPLAEPARGGKLFAAWMPWAILCAVLILWGSDWYKAVANGAFAPAFPVDGLDKLVERAPPVVAAPAPEAAVFRFTFLTYTGTGILVTAIVSGLIMGFGPLRLVKEYGRTIWALRFPLITIVCMLAVGTLTRYSGIDATLGLAFAATGVLYPFFGTMLGWLGVAATGSDTSSNILFGGLQKITSEQLGISPVLMAAANSSGGVMGKMIDTQSIVVASTATGWFGHENRILRFVFLHSLVLVSLVGVLVMLQAYVWPFTLMVVQAP